MLIDHLSVDDGVVAGRGSVTRDQIGGPRYAVWMVVFDFVDSITNAFLRVVHPLESRFGEDFS